ncbi:hypothetical protein RhiJN_18195 [Ceratobasidium sp. AG-Ba]|nr:hypothetical protein RhiJN_18195 [Ceratobasidium sp. AG-Ba]
MVSATSNAGYSSSPATSHSTSGVDLTSMLSPHLWRAQVATWASTKDTLALSATSKRFRRVLRCKPSQSMWKSHIFREYPGLPPCPPSIPGHCLVMRIEDPNCMTCDVRVGGEVDPYLLGRWCPDCKDNEFIVNRDINVDEVRVALPRTQMTPYRCNEYSLKRDIGEGEAAFNTWLSTGTEVDKAKWQGWKDKQYQYRKIFGGLLDQASIQVVKIQGSDHSTPLLASPFDQIHHGLPLMYSSKGGLIRLGRVESPRKPSANVRYSMDKDGKVPIPTHGVPSGTYVYKSNLDLIQGNQKPTVVRVLAAPGLLTR